jgi:leader peptidase (prepilin peptidase)/N-methyltransferase
LNIEAAYYVIAAFFGLFIGSFLNVCIYRIPRDLSIVWPGSKCPGCDTPIRAYDNMPVLSWIILLGKCRKCGQKISIRYPVVEALTGIISTVFFHKYGLTLQFFIYYAFACALIVVTYIDLDFQIIPDRISLGGIVVGLVCVYWLPVSYKDSLIGMALGGGILLIIIYGYYFLTGKQGMGGGDVKLLAMIGVFTGWQGVMFTLFASSLIGSVIGIAWVYLNRRDMKAAIPFGPFLSIGALIYLLWGPPMIGWYFEFMRHP